MLTAPGIGKLRPKKGPARYFHDANGLYLVLTSTGVKSWYSQWRDPGTRKPHKVFLGRYGTEAVPGEPVLGGIHTLAAARRLHAKVRADAAAGIDVTGKIRSAKIQRKLVAVDAAHSTFARAVADYIAWLKVKPSKKVAEIGNRTAWKTGKALGLDSDGSIISGGLVYRWRDRQVADITNCCEKVTAYFLRQCLDLFRRRLGLEREP